MNSFVILVFSFIFFIPAYLFYAKKIESLWGIDARRPTPAFSKYDSVDFIPARNWLVLFGHHFSSISGAGPIIGPVIAVMLWGWLPALLWIVIGSILIGGVHDFGSLIISVREGGSSVADIAGKAISRRAKLYLAFFVWLALILIIAVFAYLCADTFVKEPKIILPSLGIIPVAIIVGFLLYTVRANLIGITILGFSALILLIFLGNFLSIGILNIKFWLIILLLYAYFASILPVNILLQPRDYLSSFLLFFGVGFGYLGILIMRPKMGVPAFIGWNPNNSWLWPMLFVTVACGAVSGFHSLIASGTSSKQIANERHIKRIGYGAMVVEAIVAVLALIAAGIIFNPKDNFVAQLKLLSPIGIFSSGYGKITESFFGTYGTFIAVTILNAFILTTLDTATRISRYLTEELFGIKNRYLSTSIIILLSGILAFSGKWSKIWPAFGASNQLVAALALFVISCWLLARNKPVKFTLLPAFFMLITTIAALFYQSVDYFKNKDFILLTIAALLLILALFMVNEVLRTFLSRRKING